MRAWSQRLVALTGAILIGMGTTSCGGGGHGVSVPGVGVLRADVPRQVAHAQTGPLAAGITAFGHELVDEVAARSANTVVSPLSIALAFSMARAGAGGETAAQIDQVLHLPATGRDAAFNTLTRALVTESGPPPRTSPSATRSATARPTPPVVAIANALFAQQGLPIGAQFLHTLAADYGAGARTVDFSTGAAAALINEWVRQQTADRIDRLFDSLDPATKLVIANAVYLKADWSLPFADEPTTGEPFTRADGSTVRVPTMHQQAMRGYAAGPGWQAAELPYAGNRLAMWVLVPSGDTPPQQLLAPSILRAVRSGLRPTRIGLDLPRFDFHTDLDLVAALGQLGLHAPFSPGADFSGITPGLYVEQAVHRANITVDEWGTEAAAVTGLAFAVSGRPAPDVVVRADHPFAFAVVDRPTGVPLFVGTVGDPSAH